MPNDEIIEKAKKLGMVFVSEVKKEQLYTEDIKKPEDIIAQSIEDNKDIQEAESVQNNENTQDPIEIIIPEGLASYQISQILFENNIIEDKMQFEDYIIEKKLTKNLFYGTFIFEKNMDFENIITILSKG